MPHLLDWQRAEPLDMAQRVLPLLAAGRVVVFPSETVYLAASCPFLPDAIAQLPSAPALAVRDIGAALDWAPGLGKTARRLAQRCWPGPLTLLCADTTAPRVPEVIRPRLLRDDALPLCSPGHDALAQVLALAPWPLAVASVSHNGRPATNAHDVVAALGEGPALVIDDGPTHFCQEATVVRVQGEQWELVSEGVLARTALERLVPITVVFVCTGNTCRSPLAEALCKKLLAERLGCSTSDLQSRGFMVLSAGLQAMMGGGAAAEAIAIAQELGADLAGHRSRPLTAELLGQADLVVGMTRSHVHVVAAHLRDTAAKARLLASDGSDLADPIGSPEEVYRDCAQQILRHLEKLVPLLA